MKNKLRSQSLSEYSILLAIILIAIIGINIYVKRGLQARHKDEVDAAWAEITKKAIEENPTLTEGELKKYSQYEPYYARSTNTVDMARTTSKTISDMDKGKIVDPGKVTRSLSSEPTTVESTNTEGVNVEGSAVYGEKTE
ncbi:MAG: hypothetical protein Q8R31_04020 [Candidatus Omnitrophota bacterium]|nr:hypothetical protein [Candidatus Omnitrophota bacterium]